LTACVKEDKIMTAKKKVPSRTSKNKTKLKKTSRFYFPNLLERK
jgi:hypothetical protein